MKVYIDISEFLKIDAITGIQRVMREIIVRFIGYKEFETILLSYSEKNDYFKIVDNNRFLEFFERNIGNKEEIFNGTYLEIEEMKEGDIFFDLDVAWSATLKRSYLLPKLKKQHVKIVAQIYDIMAITHFQYFTEHFTYTFMEFIGAHLLYADTIIVSTKASLKILEEFALKVGAGPIEGKVAYLGADFKRNVNENVKVQSKVDEIVQKEKYILMVGTIEPRKNHQLVLDAFNKGIANLGYNLVFAGRIGWKNEKFLHDMETHPYYGKRIFHIANASNADIDYLYSNAFLVAFPTHMEGFGLPLVEALEHGVPVVATDIDVLKEIGGDYCYYFKANDVQDFVKQIEQIQNNEKIYIEKKEKLRTYCPITWDQSANQMKEIILNCREKETKI